MVSMTKRFNWSAWYQATRPRIFTATYVPLGLAAVIALENGVFDIARFLLALLGALLLQTGANLVNEYADYQRGADTYKQAGQGMTIKQKILSPQEVLAGAVISLVLGALVGLFLLSQSGPLLWGIGIAGVLMAILYTAGPLPLAYIGMGEITAGLAFGPLMVIGAYYVMHPTIDSDKILALALQSAPIALMVAAILHANNIRDLDADRAVNKRTLAVLLGLKAARIEYAALVWGTYALLVMLVFAALMPPTTLAALLTLPEAHRLVTIFNTSGDIALLHQAQGRTAKLHGRIGLLIVVGWLAWLAARAIFRF